MRTTGSRPNPNTSAPALPQTGWLSWRAVSEPFDQAFWDDRYRSHEALWSSNPNPHLVAEVAGLTPGTALDVGCGEGADAIWLAGHGWQVTAVDISAVALERAAGRAVGAGAGIAGRVTWLHHDLTDWEPPHPYDLVSSQYFHLPSVPRRALLTRLEAAVAPGGTLLIVGHHPSDMHTTVHRPQMPDLFYTGDEIAEQLDSDRWDVVHNTASARTATDPEGRSVTVHDTVLRATRLGG
jgi:SAM-dependent methyltransferase